MLRVRTKYSPGQCSYDGGFQEIRWDLSGCNLSCLFCWSPASRPDETGDSVTKMTPQQIIKGTTTNLRDKSKAFIRFTGGEPTLQWPAITEVLELLVQITPPRLPILFQTNGIEIGKGNIDLNFLVSEPSQYYLFEVSFKGTNEEEFSLLTGKSSELYEFQLTAYDKLTELSQLHKNIQVVAVLGVYHSATLRPSRFAFVNPDTDEILFEDTTNWNPHFASIWNSAALKWVEPLRMSPPGLWANVLRRCGEDGAKVLKRFPESVRTNRRHLFHAKPDSATYARQIVTKHFWR